MPRLPRWPQPHLGSDKVSHRTSGTGCPFCSGRKVCSHNSLATKAPEATLDWHRDKNLPLSPESVTAQSNIRAHWCCAACQHEWRTQVCVRARNGCPKCAEAHPGCKQGCIRQKHPTFASCNDPLLAQWDHDLNAREGNYPDNTTLGSRKLIWWTCNHCPQVKMHRWQARAYSRSGAAQSSCPVCAGKRVCTCNSLQTLYPEIAADFDVEANQIAPDQVTSSLHVKYRWLSDQPDAPLRSVNQRTFDLRVKRRQARQP